MSELLRQKLKQAELLLAKKDVMSQKRQEALAEQGALEPKLDRLLEKTKELQKLVREGGGPQQDAASPSSLTPAVPDPPPPALFCRSRPTSPSATADGR